MNTDQVGPLLESADPTVTIGLIAYNHGPHVGAALESIEKQSFRNFEVVVVDDCSSDGTQQIIREWSRTTEVSHTLLLRRSNQGLLRNLNDILSLANGRYLSLFAADDVLHPDKLTRQVPLMEANPDTAFVYSDALIMSPTGETTEQRWSGYFGRPIGFEGDVYPLLLQHGSFVPVLTMLVNVDYFRAIGGFREDLVHEDWDMQLRLAALRNVIYVDQPTADYRITPGSMSHEMNPASSLFNNVLLLSGLFSLRPDQDRLVRRRLIGFYFALWETGDRSRFTAMRRVLYADHSPLTACAITAAAAGVRLSWLLLLRQAFSRRRGRMYPRSRDFDVH